MDENHNYLLLLESIWDMIIYVDESFFPASLSHLKGILRGYFWCYKTYFGNPLKTEHGVTTLPSIEQK